MAIATPEKSGAELITTINRANEFLTQIRTEGGDLELRLINDMMLAFTEAESAMDAFLSDYQKVPAVATKYVAERGGPSDLSGFIPAQAAMIAALDNWRADVVAVINARPDAFIWRENAGRKTLAPLAHIPAADAGGLRQSAYLTTVANTLMAMGL